MSTTWWELTYQLEAAFRTTIRKFSSKDQWKEDAISISLLQAAQHVISGQSIEEPAGKVRIESRIFKADGKLEETYGDIALLVRIRYHDGYVLNGVAYYEAKRRDWDTHAIPAAKQPQLEKMHNNLWNGQLVVFDRDRAVTRVTETIYNPWYWDGYSHDRSFVADMAAVTHVMTMPLGPVLQCKKLDTSIYKFGVPWSSQIVLRNLQGFDLEHEQSCLDWSTRYAVENGSSALTILAIGINHGAAAPEIPEVNVERFRPLD